MLCACGHQWRCDRQIPKRRAGKYRHRRKLPDVSYGNPDSDGSVSHFDGSVWEEARILERGREAGGTAGQTRWTRAHDAASEFRERNPGSGAGAGWGAIWGASDGSDGRAVRIRGSSSCGADRTGAGRYWGVEWLS